MLYGIYHQLNVTHISTVHCDWSVGAIPQSYVEHCTVLYIQTKDIKCIFHNYYYGVEGLKTRKTALPR